MDKLFALLILYVLCLVSMSFAYSLTDNGNLEDFLKTNYKKSLRPHNTTQVGLSFGLMHINALDIVSQQIDLVGFIVLVWHDPRLEWTPSSYGNLTYTSMLMSDVWVPPLVLNNAADGLKILTDDSDFATNYVSMINTGLVWVVLPIHFKAQCLVNIKYYPFDTQECHMILTPWGFSDLEVNLLSSEEELIMYLYEENGEWEIASSKNSNFSRAISTTNLAATKTTLNLRRKYSYYLINLILPVIFLAVLSSCVFILPVESGEKNGFSLTILLSMSVMMTILSDHIPPIATQTCQLSIYLLVVFIICTLETAVTVFSCQIHQYTAKGYKPGPAMQRFAKSAAKLSCFRRPTDSNETLKDKNTHGKGNGQVSDTLEPKGDEEKRRAWQTITKLDDAVDYTYEDIAFIFDRLNFIIFFVITNLLTLLFFIILSVSGSS